MRTMIVITSIILLSSLSAEGIFPAEIVIDGKFDDWEAVKAYPDDANDTFGGPEDATMDILSYKIANDEKFLYVMVTVKDDISKGKTSRGAYQTVIDIDNDYNTGIQTDTETPYPPHKEPMGVDRYISVETKTGQFLGIGMAGFMKDAKEIGGPGEFDIPQALCSAEVAGNKYELGVDLKSIGIDMESNIRIAILHYSAANTVDWTMPAITYFVTMQSPKKVDIHRKSAIVWGRIKGK
jgi:hypothetical protein